MLKFKSSVTKINKTNTGFIKIPKNNLTAFNIGEEVNITISSEDNTINYSAKIRKCSSHVGVYVPNQIMMKHNFEGDKEIVFEKINGFSVWVNSEGRTYFPSKYCNQLRLHKESVVKVSFIQDNQIDFFYCRVRTRSKNNTEEYFVFLPKKFHNRRIVLTKIEHIKKNHTHSNGGITFNELLKKYTFIEKDKDSVIMYLGHRVPCIINTNISLYEIAHYLGCFYADGTKRGNSWGICASTFEQAKYYTQMHSILIKKPELKLKLSYTDPLKEDKAQLKKRLQDVWLTKTSLVIPINKIYIHETETKDAQNRNKYGALSFKEHKQLVLLYYNELLQYFLKETIKKKNTELALNFICGVLEGDGAPSAKARGHVIIATNKNEIGPLIKIFKVLGWKHQGYADKENKYYLRIGSLELLEHIVFLKEILFKYYQKRRKRTVERMLKTGAAIFLVGKTQKTSPWILHRFREKGILNKDNNLAAKGMKIKRALSKLEKEAL